MTSGLEAARECTAKLAAFPGLAPLLDAGERDAPGSIAPLLWKTGVALDDVRDGAAQARRVAQELRTLSLEE